jgi:hypothetical protein
LFQTTTMDILDGQSYSRLGLDEGRSSEHLQATTSSSKLQALYEAGQPFYTRAAIQQLHVQLQSYDGQKRTFYIQGVDDVTYSITLDPKKVPKSDQLPYEFFQSRIID